MAWVRIGLAGAALLLPLLAAGWTVQAGGAERAGSEVTMTGHEQLQALANDYYLWRYDEFPVAASDAGRHDADDRLADYSSGGIERRRQRLGDFRRRFEEIRTAGWTLEALADHALFSSALERARFQDTVIRPESRDPQLYVDECLSVIFSLLKKDYAPKPVRANAATARLRAMPALLEQARRNLTEPVALYAELAAESAEGAGPLFTESLESLAEGTSKADLRKMHEARDEALSALKSFAAWLRERVPSMNKSFAMGREAYARWLAKVLLLPLTPDEVVALGEAELARARATQAWLAAAASRAPKPTPPRNQEEFLRSYEAHTEGIVRFLRERNILTVPEDIGPFYSRQLPEAFKPTAPGGFMNPPGVFDEDPSGFYFIPTYDPNPVNFFLRAAIEDPRPILAHEGIPGHHFQISLANRLSNPVRRFHDDGMFIEGWAFYTEEMLERCGLYDDRPDTRAQVMQLLRMRAARIAVDVRLATGEWSFQEGVDYFIREGGLDPEAARGEAAGAAAWPGYKIQYLVGKWQIERLLGRIRDREGDAFSLARFHDRLLSYGSLPLLIIEQLMLGEEAEEESGRTGGS
jgi:uncharacterized protein (DUF885 family)